MIVAVIQARMGSTRLPGKVMLPLAGKPVLEHVITRVSRAKLVDEVIVATTIEKQDIEIVNFVSGLGYRVFAGSEEDVLDRYYQVSKLIKPEHIVRITADCPMIDPEIIDLVINQHLEENADYTSNTIDPTFPDGLDVEVFTFNALKEAWGNSTLMSEREHVTPFIRKNPQKFKIVSVTHFENLSFHRWTLDRKEDYEFLKVIFDNIYFKNPNFLMKDVLDFLNLNPEVIKINAHITRNEGYIKSLKEDRLMKLNYVQMENRRYEK